MLTGLLLLLSLVQSLCPAYSLYSGTSTLVQRSPNTYTPSVLGWGWLTAEISGSSRIWESTAWIGGEGVFTFVVTFVLAEWKRVAFTSIKLLISAEEHHAVQFNGGVVAPMWSGNWYSVSEYELKSLALGSNEVLGVRENRLEIQVRTTWFMGELIYRLDFVE